MYIVHTATSGEGGGGVLVVGLVLKGDMVELIPDMTTILGQRDLQCYLWHIINMHNLDQIKPSLWLVFVIISFDTNQISVPSEFNIEIFNFPRSV